MTRRHPPEGSYAVIFESRRPSDPDGSPPDDGYEETAARMEELARAQPGFIEMTSVRGADGHGVTVSYWESEEDVVAWRSNPEHLEAQRRGRDEWYLDYALNVCRIERSGGKR